MSSMTSSFHRRPFNPELLVGANTRCRILYNVLPPNRSGTLAHRLLAQTLHHSLVVHIELGQRVQRLRNLLGVEVRRLARRLLVQTLHYSLGEHIELGHRVQRVLGS